MSGNGTSVLKRSASQQLAEAGKSISEGNSGAVRADLVRLISEGALRPEQYSIVSNLVTELVERTHSADTVLRLAILGSYTTQPIVTAARCALLAEGMLTDIYEAPFGAYLQEILSPDSSLYAFRPDAVVIATNLSGLGSLPSVSAPNEDVEDALDREVKHWHALWEILASRLGKPVLQHLFEVPEEEFLGIAERRSGWTASRFVESLNARLIEAAPGFVRWIDVDRLAARVGRHNWHDPRLHHHAKLGFSPRFVPAYSLLLAAAWRSATGKTKKALVVDLDNTLWGGVIGDDGIDGIRLGPGTAEGEAYASFCEYLKALRQRGVILAVCSKNDRATAAEVFERHPHMPLQLSDFAVFKCSWEDKATNLRCLASDLNIDIATLVFVDDNPAECELVRQKLPEVTVINLDGDPVQFPRLVDRQHLFDSPMFSGEDLLRAESYAARSKAAEIQARAPDLGSYLDSLDMVATIGKPESEEFPRLAQMEMKTNQFNLTTRRLTQIEIERICDDPNAIVLALSLVDRFANHGLVSYMVAVHENNVLRISDWLMSCRVFSRTTEDLMFNHLLQIAKARDVSAIVGEFRPTAKNAVVSDLYSKLGFIVLEGDSGQWWRLPMEAACLRKSYIREASHESDSQLRLPGKK
jgi:FkbH-like protein